MPDTTTRLLRGVTFSHPRIVRPLLAAGERFEMLHQDVSVVWEEHSLRDFEELSLCDLSERFDLMAFDHPLLGDAIQPGCLLDLEVERPGLIAGLEQNSLGLSLESYRVGNSLWGVPFDAAAQVAAWQVSAFLKAPQPRDLPGFLRFCEEQGAESTAIPLLPAHAACTFLTVAASVKDLTPEDTKFFLDPVRMAPAFEIVRTIARHSSKSSFGLSPIALLEEMASGSPVVYSPFTFGYGTYASVAQATSPLAFGESLRASSRMNRAVLGGAGVGVSSRSQQRELAAEFAEFLVSPEVATVITPKNLGQPGTRAGWGSATDSNMKDNFFSSTLKVMESGIVRPRFSGFVDFLTAMGGNLVDAIDSGTSPKEFAETTINLFDDLCVSDPRLEAVIGSAGDKLPRPEQRMKLNPTQNLPSSGLLGGV